VCGYAGQRAPGAGLKTARFEFLYGLGARFSGGGIRLAESESRIGAIRDPLAARPRNIVRRASNDNDPSGQNDAQSDVEAELYDRFRNVWAAFSKSFNTRLGVFEAYRDGSEDPLSLEEKVAFALRLNSDYNADLDPAPWDP
jgi:hypothetical protein